MISETTEGVRAGLLLFISKQHKYQQIAKTKFSEKVIIPLNLFLTVRFFKG